MYKRQSLIVFFKDIDVENENCEENSRYSIARASHIFNVAQVDGFKIDIDEPQIDKIIACENAERFVQATCAKITIGGMRAYYSPCLLYTSRCV